MIYFYEKSNNITVTVFLIKPKIIIQRLTILIYFLFSVARLLKCINDVVTQFCKWEYTAHKTDKLNRFFHEIQEHLPEKIIP